MTVINNIPGLWVDKKFLFDEGLSPNEKILLAYFQSLPEAIFVNPALRMGHCKLLPSNAEIGRLFNLKKGTVANILTRLKEDFYIEIKYDLESGRYLKINPNL